MTDLDEEQNQQLSNNLSKELLLPLPAQPQPESILPASNNSQRNALENLGIKVLTPEERTRKREELSRRQNERHDTASSSSPSPISLAGPTSPASQAALSNVPPHPAASTEDEASRAKDTNPPISDVKGSTSTAELSSSPPAVDVGHASVREDFVALAVRFLTSPKVRDATVARQDEFLKKKSLTDEEIIIARERTARVELTTDAELATASKQSSSGGGSRPPVPPRPTTQPPNFTVAVPQQPRPTTRLSKNATFFVFFILAVGAGGLSMLVDYVLSQVHGRFRTFRRDLFENQQRRLSSLRKSARVILARYMCLPDSPASIEVGKKNGAVEKNVTAKLTVEDLLANEEDEETTQQDAITKEPEKTPTIIPDVLAATSKSTKTKLDRLLSELTSMMERRLPAATALNAAKISAETLSRQLAANNMYNAYMNKVAATNQSAADGVNEAKGTADDGCDLDTQEQLSNALKGFKDEIRSMKGALLNRRNFPSPYLANVTPRDATIEAAAT